MTTVCEIPLGSVAVDPDLQQRTEGVDQDYVRDLEAVPDHWPPVKVVKRDDRYLLVDGFHRLTAAKNLGLKEIQAEVLQVQDDEDLHALAFRLNASHGQPLTLADRRAFAARLLETHPELSNREVSRQSGLAQATVSKIREELESDVRIAETSTRIGRDGRSYSAKNQTQRTTTLAQVLDNALTALDTTGRRRLVRYLQKLADVLDEQWDVDTFETAEDSAQACVSILGEGKAQELAEILGAAAANVLDIAIALGYSEDAAS
jgi:ParB-like chromosome segregation protein Spo0J